MKKFGLFLLVGAMYVLGSNAFAVNISQTEARNFSSKLETNKNKLIQNMETSKKKLKNLTAETSKFADTTLFKAASCLGAIPEENQNLNFDTIVAQLKENILKEYIQLDGDIKRLQFGIDQTDPLLFGNKLDNFYNQNAIKINDLENDYYAKSTKAKKDFLEYLDNNKDLLTQLAQNMDFITTIQTAASGATNALDTFKKAVNTHSYFLKNVEKELKNKLTDFEAQLDKIIAEMQTKYQLNNDTYAKYVIHKENFLKKFGLELEEATYRLFSAFFKYSDYLDLLEKQASVNKQFLTSSGAINCNLLLTTSFNLGKYAEGVDSKSASIKKGLDILTKAINDKRLNFNIFDAPALEYFLDDANKNSRKLIHNFRILIESETPKNLETTPLSGETSNTQAQESPVTKQTFNQPFNKGQYHEEIKVLQTLLKNRGYYQGNIDGIYSPQTINAVYQFQLKEGVITGKEQNKSGYGRFGVRTRAKINSML